MKQTEQDSSIADRRTQTRIHVNIPVKVTFQGMTEPVAAINQDISWGGVLFVVADPPPQDAGSLRIVLPWKQGEEITADAHLIRTKPLQDGSYLIAARFFSLSPRSHSRLERLLKLLHAGQASDESSGLVRELEVTANDISDLRYMLAQITTGRHEVTVFDAYEVNQSIKLSIVGTMGVPRIRLRARVVAVQKSPPKDFDWTELYTLKLEFEHPKRSIQSFVDLFLSNLPKSRDDSETSNLADVPGWTRVTPLARVTSADDERRSGKSGVHCILETIFPEALNRLTAGWGDVEAFEVLFRDLVLGEQQGQPGGWSQDAWEELEFLQNVHDLAYGMSKSRKTLFKGGRNI
jgi:hypothetical protein